MTRSVAVLLALGCASALAWMVLPQRPPPVTEHLVDRLWIDHLPASETDLVTHLIVLKHPAEEVGGVAGRSSQWRVHLELFRYRLRGDRLEMRFPQTNDHVRATVRTWKCKGEVKEPFELCLQLKAGRRTLELYSREDWIIPTGVPDELEHLAQPAAWPVGHGDAGDVDHGAAVRDALPPALAP